MESAGVLSRFFENSDGSGGVLHSVDRPIGLIDAMRHQPASHPIPFLAHCVGPPHLPSPATTTIFLL